MDVLLTLRAQRSKKTGNKLEISEDKNKKESIIITMSTTYHKHGSEVTQVCEEFIHGGLLGVDGEVLHHVLEQRVHVVVHDDQFLVLFSCLSGEAVRLWS